MPCFACRLWNSKRRRQSPPPDQGGRVRVPTSIAERLFLGLWLFIIFVSVIDGYLALYHRDQLVELNPQGRFLIALNGGQVWLLLAAKFTGTVLACTTLVVIHRCNPRWGIAIAGILAGLQFGLLLFLLFS